MTTTVSSKGATAARKKSLDVVALALATFSVLIVIFLISPIVVVVASAFTASEFIAFPPKGLSLRWFMAAFENRDLVDALGVSMLLALINAVAASALGAMAAISLAMTKWPGRNAISTFLLSPLMLPAVVLGISLLQFAADARLLGTFTGVLLGHLLITVPYATRLVGVSLSGFNWDLYRAATNLGAHPLRAIWRVVLPGVYSGLAAAATFCLILSFDEVTISLFLTGPRVSTLPVVIFHWIEYSYDPVIAAASAFTVLMAVVAMVIIESTLGIDRVFGGRFESR